MSAMTRLELTIPMPQIARIEVEDHLALRVLWLTGIRKDRTDVVDLSPMINSLKFFRPLRQDRNLFRTAHLIEGGRIVAWGDDDEIDMAADSIEELAEETMTAGDFRGFLHSNHLTHGEAAALLGRSRRQVENYLSGTEPIPRVVVMACYGLKTRMLMRLGLTQARTQVHRVETETTQQPLIASPWGTAPVVTATPMLEDAA